jgi:hypothetical protein
VFARKGFDATIADIAAKAGLAYGSAAGEGALAGPQTG